MNRGVERVLPLALVAALVIAMGVVGLIALAAGDAASPAPGVGEGVDPDAPPSAGRVMITRNVDAEFGPFIANSTPETEAFMRRNYDRMRGFASFQDQALEWSPPTSVYQDLYAIYNDDKEGTRPNRETLVEHPDWVLRDASGDPLFIPFNCDGTTCPQYAADPGNEEFREDWVDRAIDKLRRGYTGLYVDDVNTALRVGDEAGDEVTPIDPRTGEPMKLSDWRRYIADFTELIERRVRDYDPDIEISHNPLWFEPESDPNVQRQLLSADIIQIERGFNDEGLVEGRGRFGFLRLLDHVDFLHDLGRRVLYKPTDFDEAGRDYELAGFFLVSEAGDSIAPTSFIDPDDYWPGWDVDLGEPEGRRYFWRDGLLRRDFERGFTVVNQPGGMSVEIELGPGHTDAAGLPIEGFTLGEASGKVVLEP